MTELLDGVAIVAGGASGIGRACAQRLAACGTSVAVFDVNPSLAGAVPARAVRVDVSDELAVAHAVSAVVASLGRPRILVNAAGVAPRTGLLETAPADWQRALAVNLSGYFYLLRHVVPHMRDAGGGLIVQVDSIAGHAGSGYPACTASKGAILSMTRQLASELAPWRIRINSVRPGMIEADQRRLASGRTRRSIPAHVPAERLSRPEEVAAAVEYLASPAARFITGADLVVDGGMISGVDRPLAAATPTTAPETAASEPSTQDRPDATSATVRRAIAFIEQHPDLDIGVADVAEATNVSIRGLQVAFRRHLNTTPMEYLRRVRLDRAHHELLATNPTSGATVTDIATRWGFHNHSRFAARYRRAYGVNPLHTLRANNSVGS